jgi:hypothetical protein
MRLACPVIALLLVLPSFAGAQVLDTPLHLSAVAQDLDRGVATPLRIDIERWTPDAVRDRLVDVAMSGNNQRLLRALQEAPSVGTIRTTTSLAWDLRLARQTRDREGRTQIVLGTDRPLAFSEQWSGSRTLDYPFTVVELHLDERGEGEGTLSFATKVIPDARNKTIFLENWDTQRVRLTQVKRIRKGE